ncbi:MAG: hypothetical protein ABGY41_04725 [Candidatus Poribacteria bacterium]|jgi:hypothetical protein
MSNRRFHVPIYAFIFLFVALGSNAGVSLPDPDVEWLFDEGSGDVVADTFGATNGTVVGSATWTDGSLVFDGVTTGVKFPDSDLINVTNGPWQNRTVIAVFTPADVGIPGQKQVVFEEGGRTRGAVIYVYEGLVYAAMWNRAEYNWDGEWPSAPIASNTAHGVAFVLRDAIDAVEPGRYEMWMDGQMIASLPGGELYNHGDDTGVGHTNANAVFHDDDGTGTDRDYYSGSIDSIRVWNVALLPEQLEHAATSVEAHGKLAVRWGTLKTAR